MKAKRVLLLVFAAALASGFITVGSLLFRQVMDYADFRADRFGFPYYWVEHVLETFAGSMDRWFINTENLAKNLSIYFIACFAVLLLTSLRRQKKE